MAKQGDVRSDVLLYPNANPCPNCARLQAQLTHALAERDALRSDLRDRALGNGLAEAKEKADASQAVQEGETP